MPTIRLGRGLVTTIALALIAMATLAVWFISLEAGKRRALATLDEELGLLARALESEIERFRYLPAIVSRDRRILDALEAPSPGSAAQANAYLKAVRSDSRADELFVMGLDGFTIAASNHDEATSFVGENYRFRPYFKDALAQGAGRYYAVGATTGIPGYFLSSAISDGERTIGVAIVKVDMGEMEAAWSDARPILAVADAEGVIFLSGHAPWKYRPLRALDENALATIAEARRYGDMDLAAADPILPGHGVLPETVRVEGEDTRRLLRRVRIEPDGWYLLGLPSLAPIHANSSLLALLTALAGLLVTSAALFIRQRRQLVRARLDAHAVLERRVVERTAELHAAQASLIQTAKLAALGRMSAAIVHEVSQPLAAMENTLASTGLLAARGEAEAVAGKVRAARDLVRRIQRTVKLLKSFARNEPVPLETFDAARSMAVAVELAMPRATAEGAAIELVSPAAPAWVRANATRLEQVLLNLLVNALDAVRGRQGPVVRMWCEQDGETVRMFVRDNGPGIPEHLRERIAEPFFTTKITGEGLGLGLSLSRAILDEFDGRMRFETIEGGGCIFCVELSAAAMRREAAE